MALSPFGQRAVDTTIRSIPEIVERLEAAHRLSPLPRTIVVYHDAARAAVYGFRTLDDRPWFPKREHHLSARSLLQTLWAPYERRRRHPRDAQTGPSVPHFYLAVDLQAGHVWHRQKFSALMKVAPEDRLDACTLERAQLVPTHTAPEVTVRGQVAGPEHAAWLPVQLGPPADRPEEAFLLGEELLALATDALASGTFDPTEHLDPLPVHRNAVWVFERPVRAMRDDGRERHLRALWYREGERVWRLRAYVGSLRFGSKEPIRQSGEQISGRIPFTPRLDAGHPEQLLLAAIWALMSQGGVAETALERHPSSAPSPDTPTPGPETLRIVRLKTGTEHERLYRGAGAGQSLIARSAWAVRGHWRRQPYPSLGRDADGKVVTRLIWIAAYTKGDVRTQPPAQKVITVS